MQNTPHEFAVGTEELNMIKALQMLWPLLQTKKRHTHTSQVTNNIRLDSRHLPTWLFPR